LALLATQPISRADNVATTYASVSASDTFVPDGRTFLMYKSTGTATNLTFVTPRALITDVPVTDYVVALPAAAGDYPLGPFPAEVFADPTTGLATVTASSIVGMTVACHQVTV
jgi:hypothetical protein